MATPANVPWHVQKIESSIHANWICNSVTQAISALGSSNCFSLEPDVVGYGPTGVEAAAWKSQTRRRRHTTDLWNASDWIPKWLQTLHFSLRSDLTVSLKKPPSSATQRRFSSSPFWFRFVIAGFFFHWFSSCCCRSSKQNSFNCRSNPSPHFSLLGSDN